MKKSECIVAINPDRDAPISEIADVMVLDDFKAFIPALIEKTERMMDCFRGTKDDPGTKERRLPAEHIPTPRLSAEKRKRDPNV